MVPFRIADVIAITGGRILSGNDDVALDGFASLKDARQGDLSFFEGGRFASQLAATRATAVLVPPDFTLHPDAVTCIGVSDPSRSFQDMVDRYGVQPEVFTPGIHPTAVVAASARLNPAAVSIGAHAVIADEVEIGDGVEIGAGTYVGDHVTIGTGSSLRANVTVHRGSRLGARVILHSGAVIGADGFGYEFENGRHRKVRQAGTVQIDDDVEVGAGTTIDRARFGRTWIGEGTKIDNLVQIGHNVVIGRHCIVVACAAIAGSAIIGDYVVIAAQVGVAGHVTVGSQSTLGARCGVTKDLPGKGSYLGFPAMPATEERRRLASVKRLPQLLARVQELERRLAALEPPGALE